MLAMLYWLTTLVVLSALVPSYLVDYLHLDLEQMGFILSAIGFRKTLVSALARPVDTPEIVIGLVGMKMVDGRFADAATIEFARAGFTTMFRQIASGQRD